MTSRVTILVPVIAAALLVAAPAQSPGTTARTPAFVSSTATVLSGDPVDIRLTGLEPGAEVGVTAERIYGRRPPALYRVKATFRADEAGALDLRSAKPLAAPWEGVDPRGLFWSMRKTEDAVPPGRSSAEVHLFLDVDADGEAEARSVVRLRRTRDDLLHVPLGAELPHAFLVRPPGDAPLPAIIVLGGSEGGDRTARWMAPKLASRGYAVVGLPYYSPAYRGPPQFPDLPRAFHDIPLDRLQEARDWLRQRDYIAGDRIGLYGVSKGAEFILAGASRIDGFAAVVAYVPSDVIWEAWGPGTATGRDSCFSWRGEPLPFVPYVGMAAEFAKYWTGGRVRIRTPHDKGRAAHPESLAAARIRVEDIDEPVLVVGGDADDTWDSGGMARNIVAARDAAGLPTVAIIDPDAGHALSGDGYAPTGAAEARVQGQAFPAMLEFLAQHLKPSSR